MRSSLFVSALFVGTLLAGTAAAERNDGDENRPRAHVGERHRAPTDKQRVEKSSRDRGERKVQQAYRYQEKASIPTAKERTLSKLQAALVLPKQAQERMRCENGNEECTGGNTARKSATTNADRGVKKVQAPQVTGDKNRAAAPSAAQRAALERLMNAKCNSKARNGCGNDGSDM